MGPLLDLGAVGPGADLAMRTGSTKWSCRASTLSWVSRGIRTSGATNGATCPTDSGRSQRDSIRRKPLEPALHVAQPTHRFGLRNRRSQVRILSGALT